MVVGRHGKYRFQTGMVTATLLRRGLEMADAFAISNLLRDQLVGVKRISTDELQLQINALVLDRVGLDLTQQVADEGKDVSEQPMVRSRQGLYPFSHGVLLRQLMSTGIAPDPAMNLTEKLEGPNYGSKPTSGRFG